MNGAITARFRICAAPFRTSQWNRRRARVRKPGSGRRAAVELYSNSALTTGDFDVSTPWQEAFEGALQSLGFIKPSGPGVATRGWIHPDLALGFEVVTSTLLGGLADRHRVKLLDLDADGIAAVISVEDMIADRMGQFASGTAPEMREQARRLLILHSEADRDYLDRRIREETAGDYGVEDVKTNPT